MNSFWAIKQRKQRTIYVEQWVTILPIHVRHSVGSIGPTMEILNWTIHLGVEDPVEMDLDRLKQLIENDPRLTTRCLAEQLGCSHTTVETHSNELGKTWKYGVWIPHELLSHQLQYRLDVCMDLLTSHRNYE